MIVDVYHNIRWARYKARVFSALHLQAIVAGVQARFVQIANTDGQRTALSDVDMSYHQYPHELLFAGSYENIPQGRLVLTLFQRVFLSRSQLILIPGYDRPEHWAMLFAAMLRKRKRAVFCDSTLYDRRQSRFKGLFKRLFFRLCDGYFAYGRRSQELLLHYGANPDRVFQPCQAAALPDDYAVGRARDDRMRHAPPPTLPRFLYVGRLAPEKSIFTLLQAFKSVKSCVDGSRLVIVGTGSQRSELEEIASELGIADSIEFTGGLGPDKLAEQYARATCLVLPSQSEPWGLVVNESLHYGCPVVVSNRCGCVPELVADGETGFVFFAGDADDLFSKLMMMLRMDGSKLTEHCLERISAYSPENAARNMLKGCIQIVLY